MQKFVPYEKLSKRQKRELDRRRRADWGELHPFTRRPQNSNAYDRNRDRRQFETDGAGPFAMVYCRGG